MSATIFISLSVGSVFLLSFICYINPGRANHSGNQWLAVFLACFGLALLVDLCQIIAVSSQYRLLIILSEMTRLAMAPALYLSVIYFTTPHRIFKKSDVLHFIPFLLFIINGAPALFNDRAPYFLNRFDSNESGVYIRQVMFLIVKIQVIAYWILSYAALVRHQKKIKLIFSSLEPVNLKWLSYFLLSLVFAISLWFNEQFSMIKWINDFSPVGYLIVIYVLSYFVLKQKEVFPFSANESVQIRQVIANDSQRKERLSGDHLEASVKRLKSIMEAEKCFLNSELDLPDLASRIDLTSHELSYLLNKGLGVNFFEFINNYRVDEAKRLLLSNEHQHLNILGIAYEAGFNSKTTFNTTFKKVTGRSPSQFKKESAGVHQASFSSSSR